jgi:hypothetical protein
MIILRPKKRRMAESQRLDEMAILAISSDDLPFRVAVKSPDHLPHHAHVMDKETGKKELGQFLVSDRLPAKPQDIQNYKQGISEEMRGIIFSWARRPNAESLGKLNNWELLNVQCRLNDKR